MLRNNTLYNVYATELKEEEMIKLPIVLTEHTNWELAVTEAVVKRAELEKEAESEKDYVRPIILFQAQDIKGEVTVEKLKENLIETQQIPENEIAVATGEQKELDGINLFDRNCPIRYVITIQALKEGWNCSFAYVLCSLANIKSDTAVEQLLGRVMRMPYAKKRKTASLNKAYAYVLSSHFGEATACLVEKLKNKGFSETEARDVVEQMPPYGLFGVSQQNKVVLETEIDAETVPESIIIKKENNGAQGLVFTAKTTQADIDKIKPFLNDRVQFELDTKFANYRKEQAEETPAGHGERFKVPQMMIKNEQGELELADMATVFEYFEWSLTDYAPCRLSESEFKIVRQGNKFTIDLDNNRLQSAVSEEEQYEMPFTDNDNQTETGLVRWLDKQLKDSYFSQATMIKWLSDAVDYLITDRGLKPAELMIAKYVLANKLKDRIRMAYDKARGECFQKSFFAPQNRIELNFDNGFEFFDGMYSGEICYRGSYKFTKHFLGSYNVPHFDGEADGEEFQCAKALDSNPDVKYWVRNVERHPRSFWLPTSKDKFYPDFVAQLKDGRILVVEYKGEHLATNADTREKVQIGAMWENKTNGKGLFLLVVKNKNGLTMAEQISEKIKK